MVGKDQCYIELPSIRGVVFFIRRHAILMLPEQQENEFPPSCKCVVGDYRPDCRRVYVQTFNIRQDSARGGLQIMMRSAAHVLIEHLRSSLTQIHHSQPQLHMTISETFICNTQQPSGAVYPYSILCKHYCPPKWQCIKPARPNGSVYCYQPRVLKF